MENKTKIMYWITMIRILKPKFSIKLYLFVILQCILIFVPNLQLILTQKIGDILPQSIAGGDYEDMIILLAIQAGAMLGLQLLHATIKVIDIQLKSQYKCYLEEKLHTKLSKVKIPLLERAETHNQISTLYRVIQELGFPLLKNLINFIQTILTLLVMLYIMRNIHWGVIAIIVVVSFVNVLAVQKYIKKQMDIYREISEPERKAKYFSGLFVDKEIVNEIRMFRIAKLILSKWKLLLIDIENKQMNLAKRQEYLYAGIQIITHILQFFMFLILIFFTHFTIGTYMLVSQGILQLQTTARDLVDSIKNIQEITGYLPSYFCVMQLEEEDGEQSDSNQHFHNLNKEIRLVDVSYKYENANTYALHKVNLSIKSQEKVAIVGHNGSGKTTLVKCILGLYDNYIGEIYYDDISLRRYSRDSIRQHISVLLQEFGKYPMTLEENIALDFRNDALDIPKDDVVDKKLFDALHVSDSDDFIRKLQTGIKTSLNPIYENGVDLSGGQWQKIGLARAYYKNADIVFLDEPTSAIDPLSEHRLFTGMLQHLSDKTAVILTHRLGICRWVDKIIVMENGSVIEMGTHQQLMQQGGRYCEMYQKQTTWYGETENILKKELVKQ
ncbi:hypothetical protein BVG16_03020 [Paenibacillus selenitireducens]|uniref:ABC transporter ATP-binding protein n=1 Tax=Paenibacillus selenitireducens TaxID=1324314 RepID=A0A1T2XN55_9BACL|nr:ABC transporter ATP-binding protein [Paenibacillus selenitireducens]OPA81304.1 hypothetical protein BVG16_03020 [Paenibacillus selenitireducens]